MIDIKNKSLCCGCEACRQICPRSCISMETDSEGFVYPSIEVKECIDCHLCEKVCPELNQDFPHEPLGVYAAKCSDEIIRYQSSSGGFFSMLAEKCIDNSGVVFGAKWNESWEVVHGYSDTKDGISPLRGSKYVQSRINDAFINVRDFLLQGRQVLFCGTPCQVRALKLFLGKEFNNLFLVDFVCHGVPSPGVFKWYLQEELYTYAQRSINKNSSFPHMYSIPEGSISMPEGLEIKDIRFRDKNKGWRHYSLVIDLFEPNHDGDNKTVSISSTLYENLFLRGFLSNLYLRPSCYFCPAKEFKSGSDITLGDFWEYDFLKKGVDDDLGISKVYVNTAKGEALINAVDAEICTVSNKRIAKNKMIVSSSKMPQQRTTFFNSSNLSFSQKVYALAKPSFKTKVFQSVRNLIPSGALRILKTIKYSK